MPSATTSVASSSSVATASNIPVPSSPKKGAVPVSVVPGMKLELGSYDGGFEVENERRGSVVSGEAAELLALDSSTSVLVSSSSSSHARANIALVVLDLLESGISTHLI